MAIKRRQAKSGSASYRGLMALSLLTLLAAGCASATEEALTCPTPTPRVIVEGVPPARDAKMVYADPDFYTKLIAHGSNADLEAALRNATSSEYVFVPSQLRRLRRALAYRHQAGCPEVPTYHPEHHYEIRLELKNVVGVDA